MSKITPLRDYILVEVLDEASAVVKTQDARDTRQKGKVLAVGPGLYTAYGIFVKPAVEIGDVVYWEEAAEANTPGAVRNIDQFLIKADRLIAKEE
jgi:co-chaperonin GroES (HSP10)